MSIVSLAETQGLLEQARNDLVVWSEAHPEKWATNDHDCSMRGPIGQNKNSCKTSEIFWKTQKQVFKTSKSF